jgi:DNA repair exonuclease SbcCD ATPase subunit
LYKNQLKCKKSKKFLSYKYIFVEPVEELETRVTFLQQSFVSVTKDIETLEEKVKRAKALKEELNELCQLQDYLSTGAIDETKQKIDRKRKKLENLEEMLLKAKKIQGDIKQKENDPDFMTDAVLISTTEKIEKAKQALKIITAVSEPSLNEILQEKLEARKELECVVCHDVPKAEVFSCKEQHILCLECKYSVILSCPICRQNFVETPPIRNRLAERIIQKLKWNVRNKNS